MINLKGENKMANIKNMTFDEVVMTGDVELLLLKTQQVCKTYLRGKQLIGGVEHEDVIQEVLLKVFRVKDRYNEGKGKASTYFHTVISNMIKDCAEKATSGKAQLMNSACQYDEISTMDENDDDEVQGAFMAVQEDGFREFEIMHDIMHNAGLTDREKVVFKLRCDDDLDNKDIAERLGVSGAMVTKIWRSIREKVEMM